MLRDKIGFDELKKKVVNPLTGRKIGAYYGCLLLRPNDEMQFDDPENPSIIEDFIRAIGAQPVIYPYRNECCGGYVVIEDKDAAKKTCDNILSSAQAKGAEAIVTACPLCRYNLDQKQRGPHMFLYTILRSCWQRRWELRKGASRSEHEQGRYARTGFAHERR